MGEYYQIICHQFVNLLNCQKPLSPMLFERFLSIACTLTATLSTLLTSGNQNFGASHVRAREIVLDALTEESVPMSVNREAFFNEINRQDKTTKARLDLLFTGFWKYSTNFVPFNEVLNEKFIEFIGNEENRVIAEAIIQKFVVNPNQLLSYVSYQFKAQEFLDSNTGNILIYLKDEILRVLQKGIAEITKKYTKTEGRIRLKALLYWTVKISPIEDVESAFNYAWLSIVPLAHLKPEEVLGKSGESVKYFIAKLVEKSQESLKEIEREELIGRSRAASFKFFNLIRPEREFSHELYMEYYKETDRSNEFKTLYRWDYEQFVAQAVEIEEFNCLIKSDSELTRFFAHFIIQNYEKSETKLEWESLFYTAIRDLHEEIPGKGLEIRNELLKCGDNRFGENDHAGFLIEQINDVDLINLAGKGHLSSLKLILNEFEGVTKPLLKEILIKAIENGQRKVVKFIVESKLVGPWTKAVQIAAHVDYPEILWALIGNWPVVIETSLLSSLGRASNIFFYPGYYNHVMKRHVFKNLKIAEKCLLMAIEFGVIEYGNYIKQVCENSESKVIWELLSTIVRNGNERMFGYILKYRKSLDIHQFDLNVLTVEEQKKWLELILIYRPDFLLPKDVKADIVENSTEDLGAALEAIAYTDDYWAFDALKDKFAEYVRTTKEYKHLVRTLRFSREKKSKKIREFLLDQRPVLSLIFTRAISEN